MSLNNPDGLLEYLVHGIVRDHAAVKIAISLLPKADEIALVLEVAPADLSLVLGNYDDASDGDTAFALEQILNATFAWRPGITFHLDIVGEPEEITARRRT